MARIKFELPGSFEFSTDMALRISDINYGGHLGHDSVLSLTHEARVRFFRAYGFSELDVFGPGIVLSDVAIVYKSECFYGDTVRIEIAVCDFTHYGCDLVYRVSNKETGEDVAYVKTGIVFMHYEGREVAPVPEEFKDRFKPSEYVLKIDVQIAAQTEIE